MSEQSDADKKEKSVEMPGVSPSEIDWVVCRWSVECGVALSEAQLNSLVDRLSLLIGATQ